MKTQLFSQPHRITANNCLKAEMRCKTPDIPNAFVQPILSQWRSKCIMMKIRGLLVDMLICGCPRDLQALCLLWKERQGATCEHVQGALRYADYVIKVQCLLLWIEQGMSSRKILMPSEHSCCLCLHYEEVLSHETPALMILLILHLGLFLWKSSVSSKSLGKSWVKKFGNLSNNAIFPVQYSLVMAFGPSPAANPLWLQSFSHRQCIMIDY